MASTKFYFADSKISVRKKLGLQDSRYDEAFFNFEASCRTVYRFRSSFDSSVSWKDIDYLVLSTAEEAVAQDCRRQNIKLGVTDAILRGLTEWKLYQLHRAAQKKQDRHRKRNNGTTEHPSTSTADHDSIDPPSSVNPASDAPRSESAFQPVIWSSLSADQLCGRVYGPITPSPEDVLYGTRIATKPGSP